MYTLTYLYYLLQVETVGPEGSNVFWLLLFLALGGIAIFFILGKKKFILPTFSGQVKVSIGKNKIYHPTIIHLKVENRSKNAITIENPIIRFKRIKRSVAYKIKAVNSSKIYPLYLEAGQTHKLPVALEPFYSYNRKLKRYSRLRIEFTFDKKNEKRSRFLLLKPTLFRKAKR